MVNKAVRSRKPKTCRNGEITFKPKVGDHYSTEAKHIAIVVDSDYNPQDKWFRYCCIIDARGWNDINNDGIPDADIRYGRVRYEDLVQEFSRSGYKYKFLRFTN
jgi:hypothetical protein